MSQNIYVDRTLQFNKGGGGTLKIIMDADDSANILYILPATDATESICFGNATKNLDVTFYGGTTGTSLLWDESLDKLLLTAVWSTAGLTGRPLEVSLTTTAALGSYVNAIKGYVNLSTGGSSSGLFSVFNGEMNMATTAGTPGHYAIYEAEITCPTSWTGANDLFFFWLQASGSTVTNFDTYGNLFNLKGLTSGTGSMLYGNTIRFQLADSAKYLFYSDTQNTIAASAANLGQFIVLTGGTNTYASTAGTILQAGTSGTPFTNDTVGQKFICLYTDTGATSGTEVGFYHRNYVTGTAGGYCGMRIYSDIVGVAAETVQGIQATVGTGESTTVGRVTGLGVAVRGQIGIANGALSSGTYAPLQAEYYSFGTGSDVSALNSTSFIRFANDGATNGKNEVDDHVVLFDFGGFTTSTGHLLYDHAGTAPTNTEGSIKIRLPSGALAYIMYYDSEAA